MDGWMDTINQTELQPIKLGILSHKLMRKILAVGLKYCHNFSHIGLKETTNKITADPNSKG